MNREELMEQHYQQDGPYHRRRFHGGTIRYDIARKLLPKDLTSFDCCDFGGGDGAMASMLANRGAAVTLVDPIHIALSYAQAADDRLRIAEARTYLPFRDNSFDIITMLECLEHITNEEEMPALCEAQRVLRPEGLFIISVPSAHREITTMHYRHYELDDLQQKLGESGLEINRVVPYKDLSGIPTKALRIATYGADLAVRTVTPGMGLVSCKAEHADAFVVLAQSTKPE